MQEGGQLLQARLQQQLQEVSMEDAVLMTRMCGHYLNLTAIAETLHMCAHPSNANALRPMAERCRADLVLTQPHITTAILINCLPYLDRADHEYLRVLGYAALCLHFRVRCAKETDYEFSHRNTIDRLLRQNCTADQIYDTICSQA